MINYFGLSNIKSFSRLQMIEFAPITLIYGPNSSGKSSVIQALLLLKQTLLAEKDTDHLITNGKFASLGGFKGVVHQHDLRKEVQLSIGFEQNYDAGEYVHKTGKKLPFANSACRHAAFLYSCDIGDKANLARLKKFDYSFPDKKIDLNILRYGSQDSSRYRIAHISDETLKYLSQETQLDVTPEEVKDYLLYCDNLNIPAKVVGKKSNRINAALAVFFEDMKDHFSNIKYLGPLRSAPKRVYSSEDYLESQSKGKQNLGLELHKSGNKVTERINAILSLFDIPYKIASKDIGDERSGQVISISLVDLRSGAEVTPVDVGFGIGQVLPIILEALVSKNNTICVEQPEIHLHPKLQANLADLFIESVEIGNQWIIETHSEALMLRLQKRIKQGKISKNMVSVIYVDVGTEGASAINIPLDKNGEFTMHWPGGFFEERLEELYGA